MSLANSIVNKFKYINNNNNKSILIKEIIRKNHGENVIVTTIQDDVNKKPHTPVMLNEVIKNLDLKKGNLFLDMTFGSGGHSLELLNRVPDLKILALDRDPIAYEYALNAKEKHPDNIYPLLGKFSDLPQLLNDNNIKANTIDGILLDLGCSSMQFDTPERGFSINNDGPLDMRMDCDRIKGSLTAGDVITHATEIELYNIFKKYGEEKRSRKIARAITQMRNTFKPIKTTKDLNDLISVVLTDVRYDKLNRKTGTGTKIFQALRIFVNNELNELNYAMTLAHHYLKVGSRAVVLTFHSLEDVIVKRHFKNQHQLNYVQNLPLNMINSFKTYDECEFNSFNKQYWIPVNKKVLIPNSFEVCNNPRSRSAKLRAAIKTQESVYK